MYLINMGILCSQGLQCEVLIPRSMLSTDNRLHACDEAMPQQAVRDTSFTRETVQPPQPAPVRREASAPCCLLSCMRWSSSSQLHSYRSLHASVSVRQTHRLACLLLQLRSSWK